MSNFDFVESIRRDAVFVGGEWVSAVGGKPLELICPSTEVGFAKVATAGAQELNLAIASARRAFDEGPWPHMPVAERARMVLALADRLQKDAESLAYSWTAQIGTPITLSQMSVPAILDRTRYTASLALEYPFEELRELGSEVAVIRREPVGVVAAIAPWNAPFGILMSKIVASLLCGCTVVAKPSPETPLEALIIAEAAREIGFPAGVISVIVCQNDVADLMISDRRIDKVCFTGSSGVGRHIAKVCSDRLARTTLELGGKSAAIILDDADLDDAIPCLVPAFTMLSGQVCAALTRIVVTEKMKPALIDKLAKALDTVAVGDPFEKTTVMGPIAMQRQLERIETMVAEGIDAGAVVASGGKRIDRCGYYYEPTILTNVDEDMAIAQEEIFGPVACIIGCTDEADAVRIANNSRYGLSGAVFTTDAERGYRVASQVRTGNFTLNGHMLDPRVPFGGFKQSGIGREGGPEGLDAFIEFKSVMLSQPPASFQLEEI